MAEKQLLFDTVQLRKPNARENELYRSKYASGPLCNAITPYTILMSRNIQCTGEEDTQYPILSSFRTAFCCNARTRIVFVKHR